MSVYMAPHSDVFVILGRISKAKTMYHSIQIHCSAEQSEISRSINQSLNQNFTPPDLIPRYINQEKKPVSKKPPSTTILNIW